MIFTKLCFRKLSQIWEKQSFYLFPCLPFEQTDLLDGANKVWKLYWLKSLILARKKSISLIHDFSVKVTLSPKVLNIDWFWKRRGKTKLATICINQKYTYSALGHFSCIWLFLTLWIIACQAPLSIGFSRQEYWAGWPFPPPGVCPNSGIKTVSVKSPALVGELFIP